MSTTKIIKGWVQCNADRFFGPAHDDNSIVLYEGCNELDKRMNKRQPATLYIGPGKLWTEDEVRAMVREMVDGVSAGEELTQETTAAKHGLTL